MMPNELRALVPDEALMRDEKLRQLAERGYVYVKVGPSRRARLAAKAEARRQAKRVKARR